MKVRVIVGYCCVDVGCDCDMLFFQFDRFSHAAEFIKLCLSQGYVVEVRTNKEEVE